MSVKSVLWASAIAGVLCVAALAQGPPPPQQAQSVQVDYGVPSLLGPQQLDNLVERIALYPDPLLAQVLTGSTYWNETTDAATWANQHSYLRADELSRAMYEDNLPFDPSVLALIPFPSVLDMMARDPGWTQALGNAVLSQRPDVMDAVQRMRQKALDDGYLQSNAQDRVVVAGPGDIEILPVNPGYVYVPYYNPAVCICGAAARLLRRRWHHFRTGDLCGGVRAVRLVRSGAGMAYTRDPDRSSAVGAHMGEPRQIRTLVRRARGAAGWATRGTSRRAPRGAAQRRAALSLRTGREACPTGRFVRPGREARLFNATTLAGSASASFSMSASQLIS